MIKNLEINPSKFEVFCSIEELEADNNFATINVRLSSDGEYAMGAVTAKEAHMIAVWFLKLSEDIKRVNKPKPKPKKKKAE